MSEASKAARAANKAKAVRLTSAKTGKVDASDYTTPGPMNATVQTGMRPVSPRAFKRGGKVAGDSSCARADKAPRARKDGGKVEYPIVDKYLNRDMKKANELREGTKQTGGMKSGGRTKKQVGGTSGDEIAKIIEADKTPVPAKPTTPLTREQAGIKPGLSAAERAANAAAFDRQQQEFQRSRKRGGKVEKFEGSAKDESQDKKLAKKHGMSMAAWEKSKMDTKHDKQQSMKGLKSGGTPKKMDGGALLGGILPSLAQKDPKKLLGLAAGNMKKGGRVERKAGGRVKPKTNINIVIQAGGKPDVGAMPPMGPPPAPPVVMPPAMPPAGMGAGLPPMGPPPGLGGGMPPMARKRGGRVFRSYKDMTAGAGSGEGRLEKTEIASRKR